MTQRPRADGLIHKLFASQFRQNIISNYLSVLWMGGLSLALIPIYLRLLGPSQWGLVAVCMSMQAFMSLLDMGFGQIMPRDIARVCDRPQETARTFIMFSRAYLGLGLIGLLFGQLAIPWVVDSWLHQGQVAVQGAALAFRLVLAQFLFQFANNAHIGYWNGLQAQRLANIRQCIFATAKHLAALTAIVAWDASATAYLLPFVFVSMVEYLANRRTVRREIAASSAPDPTFEDYKGLASQAGLLSIGVLVGMLVSQVDRIVLSRAVDIAAFGRYVIVANLGLAFMQLQYPLVRAYFPRIVRAEATSNVSSVRNMAAGIFILCILPCALVGLFAPLLLDAWTRDFAVVRDGVAPMRFILAAVALNAAYQPIYQRILSRGSSHLILRINVVVLLVVVPTAILATHGWGAAGAGFTWLAGAVVQFSLGFFLSRRGEI